MGLLVSTPIPPLVLEVVTLTPDDPPLVLVNDPPPPLDTGEAPPPGMGTPFTTGAVTADSSSPMKSLAGEACTK